MHLDNLHIEIRANNLRSFSREPEQCVYSNAKIRGKKNWHRLRRGFDQFDLFLCVTGRAKNERLFVLEASSTNELRRFGLTKIDYDVRIMDR